mmetsp:Transcript_481/g.1128  ORF Transcript_481/g.1128 Transcript_481/m.1128 type:complete len:299 (+) Transcript_481:335-1231(+)
MVSSSADLDHITTAMSAVTAISATPTTILGHHHLPDEPSPETVQVEADDKSIFTYSTSASHRGKDSQEIRSRLLNRLGIYGASAQPNHKLQSQPMTAAQHRRVRILRGMGVGYTMSQSPPDGSARRDILGGVVPFQEELKAKDVDGDGAAATTTTIHLTSAAEAGVMDDLPPKTTRIAFQDVVDVMPIPTRHEYSDRIKSRIWSNRHELQENAERNAVEFASEGWKWENVIEDEGMYICSASGELVHPAWVGDMPRAAPTPAATPSSPSSTTPAAIQSDDEPASDAPRLERGNPAHDS